MPPSLQQWGNQLTLCGERKAEHESKEGNYFHREVRYGSFARSFTIPEGVKAEEGYWGAN